MAIVRDMVAAVFAVLALGAVAACATGPAAAPAQGGAATMQTAPARADGKVDVWIMAKVPAGSGDVYITGNVPELGPWKADARRMGDLDDPAGTERVARIALPVGQTFEFKLTLGHWSREGLGPSGMVLPNQRLVVAADTQATRVEITDWKKDTSVYLDDVAGSGVQGTLVYWRDVASAHLGPARNVSVWLPPGYERDSGKRYRVIYMSDGQNLFDPRIANTGSDWGIDEAMVAGMQSGAFEPAIVVASWSTDRRFVEYSPWHDARLYARFVIDELMPRVNAQFRTLTGPQNTFHMGSSMGGLLSFYLVKEHPEHFSACGCLSTHFPLSPAVVASFGGPGGDPADARPFVLADIARGDVMPKGQRLYFDHGTLGLDAEYGPSTGAVADWLKAQGFIEGQDFKVTAFEGSDHNEASWRKIVGLQLEWMLAAR